MDVKYIPTSIHTIPRITMAIPRFPCSCFHVYAPRIIAAEPNISGTMNRARMALMIPNVAKVPVPLLVDGYDGIDGGKVD